MKKILFASFLLFLITISSLYGYRYYQKKIFRPHLTVVGFIEMSDGLGRQTVEIIGALKDKVSVRYKKLRPQDNLQDVPSDVLSLLQKPCKKMGKVILYEDIIHRNTHTFFNKYFKGKNSIRLAYSMFESSEIPLYWVHNLNLYFDAVIVPDPFLVSVYKNSGVKIPIFTLPLGLSLEPFLKAPLKKSSHSPLVFGNFGTCIERKNHLMLIKAFHSAFGNDPTVHLWINCKYSRDDLFEKLQAYIKELGVDNIKMTNHCFDRKSYIEQFQKIDCYVTFSQAEGFSIQPREAMALGIPCILSDNTAQTTICNTQLVRSVPCPFLVPAYFEHFKEVYGYAYEVDFEECVKALKDVQDNYTSYLERAQSSRDWASQYDYKELRSLYESLINPKKVILGDTDEIREDCLITSSSSLYQKYLALSPQRNSH